MAQSTNAISPLEDTMDRLAIDSTTGSTLSTPSSPFPESKNGNSKPYASASTFSKPSPKTFQRSPSFNSVSARERTVTPLLNRKSSYSSLQSTSGSHTPPRSPTVRRVSSNVSMDQPLMGPRSSLPAPTEELERAPTTAATVAREYFKRELEVHQEGSGPDKSHQTVVILQDDCYGHRYSRPRTSRASLGTIVERPEPLSSQAAVAIHGAQWMNELKTMCDAAESKLALNGKELARPQPTEQAGEKNNGEKPKLHEGDLYLCSGSLEALEGSIGGVCEAVDAVFRDGGQKRAFVCIRPPGHHCSADMPSGFCWVNNVHIGINYATRTHDLTHAAIIDFDLHHGDGSQSITWAHNAKVTNMPKNTPQSKRTAIGYFSLHDINSYPCEGGDDDKVRNASLCLENAHGQTIWNVHLQPWKTDKEFWELYQDRYIAILSKARSFLRSQTDRLKQAPLLPRPKAAIFLSAGFDASEWESPGMQRHQVNVPTDFYARFTRDVVAMADEEDLGVDGRVISVLEGGYSDRALMSGVFSHLSGLTASETSRPASSTSNGLGHEMSQRLDKLEINGHVRQGSGNIQHYRNEALDPSWWSLSCLEEIERLVNPQPPTAAPKKNRSAVPPTYYSSTQSYTAKMVSPQQNRRSLSGSIPTSNSSMTTSPRAPSPPPPPVDWATAAYELSKLLVPLDRQTSSCKPEDLNAEATRARRDRQSNIGLPMDMPANDGKRMQLRDRKAKPPRYASDEENEKAMSRANRRRTIADVTALPHEADEMPPMPVAADTKKVVKPKARRSSMASSVGSIHGDRSSPSDFSSSAIIPPASGSVAVKKNRAPTSSRPDGTKVRVSRPKAPVPPVPRYSATVKPSQDSISLNAASAPLAENIDLKNRDVDQLATGIKKMSIKLNVPSKDEQKIREAKRGPVAPRGRPKGTASKTAQASSDAQKPTKEPPLPAKGSSQPPTNDGEIRVQELLSFSEPSKDSNMPSGSTSITSPPSAPSSSTLEQASTAYSSPPDQPPPSFLPSTAQASPAPAPSTDSSGIPPRPQLPQPPISHSSTSMPSNQHLSPLPRSSPSGTTLTPTTPRRTKQDLPIFSSTTPIPFKRPVVESQSLNGLPRQQTDGEDRSSQWGLVKETTSSIAPTGLQQAVGGSLDRNEEGEDISDVPDKPQQGRSG
ncbi:MAG: hypothetical protein Q9170_001803 [Blastenia crenularia]